jgi:hypothetical protein
MNAQTASFFTALALTTIVPEILALNNAHIHNYKLGLAPDAQDVLKREMKVAELWVSLLFFVIFTLNNSVQHRTAGHV